MMLEKLGEQLGIDGIVLATSGMQGLAKASGLLRVDGIDREAAHFDQRVNE